MRLASYDKLLPVSLSEDQARQRTVEQQSLYREIEELEVAHAKVKDTHKLELAKRKARIHELVDVIMTRTEERMVPVQDEADYDRYHVDTIRMDTGEMVGGGRDMTMAERQIRINIDRPSKPPVVDVIVPPADQPPKPKDAPQLPASAGAEKAADATEKPAAKAPAKKKAGKKSQTTQANEKTAAAKKAAKKSTKKTKAKS